MSVGSENKRLLLKEHAGDSRQPSTMNAKEEAEEDEEREEHFVVGYGSVTGNRTRLPPTKISYSQFLATTLGSVVEWSDFVVYGYVADELSEQFFNYGQKSTNMILTYLVFSVGFAARPLGGVILGRFGDTIGRKFVLRLSVALMTASTLCMAVLPTTKDIGIWATLMLIICRAVQGICASAQSVESMLILYENGNSEEKYTFAMLNDAFMSVGLLVASISVWVSRACMNRRQMVDFGWRIPFIISSGVGILTVFVQWSMQESMLYTRRNPRSLSVSENNESSASMLSDQQQQHQHQPTDPILPSLSMNQQSSTLSVLCSHKWFVLELICVASTTLGLWNALLVWLPSHLQQSLDEHNQGRQGWMYYAVACLSCVWFISVEVGSALFVDTQQLTLIYDQRVVLAIMLGSAILLAIACPSMFTLMQSELDAHTLDVSTLTVFACLSAVLLLCLGVLRGLLWGFYCHVLDSSSFKSLLLATGTSLLGGISPVICQVMSDMRGGLMNVGYILLIGPVFVIVVMVYRLVRPVNTF